MNRSERETGDGGVLHANLKHLVTQLSEGELLLLQRWIEQEVDRDRHGARRLRVVGEPPSEHPTPDPAFTVAIGDRMSTNPKLAGAIRKELHKLREDSLLQALKWVQDQLALYSNERR